MNTVGSDSFYCNLPTAGITRRLLALFYDYLLLLGVSFGYGLLVVIIRRSLGFDTFSPPSNIDQTFILAGLWVCCALLYCWCWRKSGQTLGMKCWRIRLQNPSGTTLDWRQCCRRSLIATLVVGLFGLGILWCLIDKNGDSLQDRLTKTRVVVLPKGR